MQAPAPSPAKGKPGRPRKSQAAALETAQSPGPNNIPHPPAAQAALEAEAQIPDQRPAHQLGESLATPSTAKGDCNPVPQDETGGEGRPLGISTTTARQADEIAAAQLTSSRGATKGRLAGTKRKAQGMTKAALQQSQMADDLLLTDTIAQRASPLLAVSTGGCPEAAGAAATSPGEDNLAGPSADRAGWQLAVVPESAGSEFAGEEDFMASFDPEWSQEVRDALLEAYQRVQGKRRKV